MKMEAATTSDILKLSSAKSTDTGGLTFGPAWLRQLSSGDSTKMSALPPSPGLAFQLAKHRYGREEMLVIYEAIEKALFTHPPPTVLATEFEDLFKKDLQRPVLLAPPTPEEQKCLSTCVNSLAALNSYNKLQGTSGGQLSTASSSGSGTNQSGRTNNSENASSTSSRGGLNSTRGSRGASLSGGQTGRGGSFGASSSERGGGGGRGRGRGRGTDSPHLHKATIDEEGNPVPTSSSRGGGRGGYQRGSYTRPSNSGNWEEREPGVKKEYSRAMSDDNWRSKASVSEGDSAEREIDSSETNKDSSASPVSGDAAVREKGEEIESASSLANSNSSNDLNSKRSDNNVDPKVRSNWRNQQSGSNSTQTTTTGNREWPSYKKPYSSTNESSRSRNNTYNDKKNNDHPEWMNDEEDNDDEGQENQGQSKMTFDESGKFVSVKDLKADKNKQQKKEIKSKPIKPDESNEKERAPVETSQVNPTNEEPKQSSNDSNLQKQQQQAESIPQQTVETVSSSTTPDLDLASQKLTQLEISNDPQTNSQASILLSNLASTGNLDAAALKTLLQQNLLSNANDLISQLKNTDPKLGAVSMEHPDAERWFYLDPQNQIQGSFSSEQMAGWFAAGYFTVNLMVKRGCDEKFVPLGVLAKTLGRVPFAPSPVSQTQPKPQAQSQPNPQVQQPQQWSKEQLLQQMQLFQQMQQLQFFPQNFNLLQNQLASQQKAGLNTSNVSSILQQLQQLQLQQKTAVASMNSLGANAVSNTLNDLRMQQEALINQISQATKPTSVQQQQQVKLPDSSVLTVLDPAILDAALPSQSIWGDVQANTARISPISNLNLNPTPPPIPTSISPINNLLQQVSSQAQTGQLSSLLNNPLLNANAAALLSQQLAASNNQYLVDNNPIKDKIQALFEQTKKEEEKRKKLEEEYQLKLKREEEEKRRILEEARLKQQQEEALKRAEEDRIREEQRKEQQKKKLEEIIKKQEEEKRKNDELKKRKEEEKRKNEELKRQKEEQKRLELIQKQQQEEAERKRQLEQQAELLKKQVEAEKQKQKLQQEQLNNLQLPSHVQWAKQQAAQQMPNVELKTILEQQALEQKMEQLKQNEVSSSQQNSGSSSWSSLFRGQQQSPPSAQQSTTSPPQGPQPISLATIQAEQIKTVESQPKQAVTMSQKIQQQTKPLQQSNQNQNKPTQGGTAWAAWGNKTTGANQNDSNNNSSGFWSELMTENKQQSKSSTNNSKSGNNNTNQKTSAAKNQFPDLPLQNNQNETKSKKANQVEQSIQQTFLRNMTISDEFMKWCHEQLRDFHVELHIPTFVNFLREIETCAEIEDYVINYLGDSKQAKDFAQQFFINRESQLSQQNNFSNNEQLNDDPSSQFSLRENQFSSKQKQKRRSKGQKLDSQLLGFTVQPDPNLKNRGELDSL